MIEGCEHHSVKHEYIEWLKTREQQLRGPKEQWKSYTKAPEGDIMTVAELAVAQNP